LQTLKEQLKEIINNSDSINKLSENEDVTLGMINMSLKESVDHKIEEVLKD